MEIVCANGDSVELTCPSTTQRAEPALVSSDCSLGNLTCAWEQKTGQMILSETVSAQPTNAFLGPGPKQV